MDSFHSIESEFLRELQLYTCLHLQFGHLNEMGKLNKWMCSKYSVANSEDEALLHLIHTLYSSVLGNDLYC